MKNLKRALSLALACVMLLGMMVMTTSAADFTDNDEIVNNEAVDTMVSLNIINGKGDGSYFDPTGIVTRAEMAKMICVALNGGKDPQLGTTAYSFTDTVGNWAAGYIEYCYNLGIVSGRGAGIFDPNATVTGTEAAKMLLVAIGYNSDSEGFTGASWTIAVNVRANQKDFYDGLDTMNPSVGLTRDNAAQMVFNAINAQMVEYEYKVTTANGVITTIATLKDKTTSVSGTDTAVTVLTDKYSMNTSELTLNGNYYTGDAAKKDQIDVGGRDITYTLTNGLKWIGETVTVLWKESGDVAGLDSKDKIYGVYNDGTTTVYNTTKGALQTSSTATKIKFGDVEYSVAAATGVVTYINYNYGKTTTATAGAQTAAQMATAFTTALKVQSGDTIKFVCDDDGKIVKAFVIESTLNYVTAVNSDKVSLNTIGALEIADNNIYTGIAKNDIVVATSLYPAANAVVTVVPAQTVVGEVTGYTSTTKVAVEGTTYKIVNTGLAATLADKTVTTAFSTSEIGDQYTMYMVNGMVAGAVQASDDTTEYAVVIDTNTGKLGSSMSAAKAELLLADGTKVIATLHKDSVIKIDSAAYANDGATIANDGTVALDNTATGNLQKGQLVQYTVLSDGTYKITEVGTYATGAVSNLYDKDLKTFSSAVTSGECPLFVYTTEYKVYSIRDLGNVSTAAGQTYGYYTKDGKVVAAYAVQTTRPSGSTSNMVYGIVSTSDGVVEIDSDYYNKYTVANDTTSYTVYLPTANTLTVGALVGFDKASDNTYAASDIEIYEGTTYNATNGLATRVKSYSEADQTLTIFAGVTGTAGAYVGASATTVALDDECVIVYVNQNDDKAGENVGISAFDGITGYKNVVLVKDSSTAKVVAIFVESSSDAAIITSNSSTVTLGALSAAFTAANAETVTVGTTSSDVAITSASFAWKTSNTFATASTAPTNLSTTWAANSISFVEGAGASVVAGSYYVTITFTLATGETVTNNYTLVVAA